MKTINFNRVDIIVSRTFLVVFSILLGLATARSLGTNAEAINGARSTTTTTTTTTTIPIRGPGSRMGASLMSSRSPLVMVNGQIEQLPVTDYLSSPGGASFNATPAIGAGDIEVTTINGAAPGTASFGGFNVLLEGDSNINGKGDTDNADPSFAVTTPYAGATLASSINAGDPATTITQTRGNVQPYGAGGGVGMGIEISLAKYLVNHRASDNLIPHLIKFAWDGRALDDWQTGGTFPVNGSPPYLLQRSYNFVDPQLAASGAPASVLVYGSGANDAVTLALANAYQANLTSYMATMRAHYGSQLFLVLIQLHASTDGAVCPYVSNVRAAQIAYVSSDPNSILVNIDDTKLNTDNRHWSANGLIAIGNRVGEVIGRALIPGYTGNRSYGAAPWLQGYSPASKGNTSLTPVIYPHVANDVIYVHAVAAGGTGSSSIATPGGWTLVGSQQVGAFSGIFTISAIFRKVATAAGTTGPTLALPATYTDFAVRSIVVRNANTTTPEDVASGGAATTNPGNSVSFSGATTSSSNELVMTYFGAFLGGGAAHSLNGFASSGLSLTKYYDDDLIPFSNHAGLSMATAIAPTAGTYGSVTATYTASYAVWGAQSVAINPAPVAAGGVSGSLTSGTIPVATGPGTLADSTLVKSGSAYTLTGSLSATSTLQADGGLRVIDTVAARLVQTANSIDLATTVAASSCTSCNLTYDAYGRITVATNGSGGGGPTGTGTANKMTKWTGTSTIGNSAVTDDATTFKVGVTNPLTTQDYFSIVEATGAITSSVSAPIGLTMSTYRSGAVNNGTAILVDETTDYDATAAPRTSIGISVSNHSDRTAGANLVTAIALDATIGGSAPGRTAYGVRSTISYTQNDSYAVAGYASGVGGVTNYGLYGSASGATTNWAIYGQGNGYVSGTLQADGGNRVIDTVAARLVQTANSIDLATTVAASSCTSCNLTYDAYGRITVATNGSGGGGISGAGTTGKLTKWVIGGSTIGDSLLTEGTGIITESSSSTDTQFSITNTGTSGRNFVLGSGSSGSGIAGQSFYIYDGTATALRWSINSTGAVTNAGSLTADGGNRVIDTVAARLVQTANSIDLATTIAASTCTNCNLTYDAYGRLTAATNGSAGGVSGGTSGKVAVWSSSTTLTSGLASDNGTYFRIDNAGVSGWYFGVAESSINLGYGDATTATGYINARSNAGGFGASRNLQIQDGQAATIATFSGFNKDVTLANTLHVNGAVTTLGSATASSLIFDATTNGASSATINSTGYNGGSTQARSLDIGDGKGGKIASFAGGNGATKLWGAAIIGSATASSLIFDDSTNGASSATINGAGYQSGTTQFRSLDIGDGKGGKIASFSASNTKTKLWGNVIVGSAAGADISFDDTTNTGSTGSINGTGYQGGTTQFRSLAIGNGKNGNMLTFFAAFNGALFYSHIGADANSALVPAPTVSCSGGSATIVASDNGGIVSIPNASTSCTITFGQAWAGTPACTAVTTTSGGGFVYASSIAAGSYTFTSGGTSFGAGSKLIFNCMGVGI